MNYKKHFRSHKQICKTRIILKNRITQEKFGHDHAPEKEKVEKLEIQNQIINLTFDTKESARDIILKTVLKASRECKSIMPKLKTMIFGVKKDRNKIIGFVPKYFYDIQISLRFYNLRNFFLQFDSDTSDPNRFIIFFHTFKKNVFKKIQGKSH